MNCMQVFHYLANLLKDVPLFDSNHVVDETAESGAIYNDFDFSPMELLHADAENSLCYSQTTNSMVQNTSMCTILSEEKEGNEADQKTTESIREAVDYAVMAADKTDGIFYEHL